MSMVAGGPCVVAGCTPSSCGGCVCVLAHGMSDWGGTQGAQGMAGLCQPEQEGWLRAPRWQGHVLWRVVRAGSLCSGATSCGASCPLSPGALPPPGSSISSFPSVAIPYLLALVRDLRVCLALPFARVLRPGQAKGGPQAMCNGLTTGPWGQGPSAGPDLGPCLVLPLRGHVGAWSRPSGAPWGLGPLPQRSRCNRTG